MILKFSVDEEGIIYINTYHVRKFDYHEPLHGASTIVFGVEFSNGEKITYYGKVAQKLHKAFVDVFEAVDLDLRAENLEETDETNEDPQ